MARSVESHHIVTNKLQDRYKNVLIQLCIMLNTHSCHIMHKNYKRAKIFNVVQS